jgi:ABC-2 type transport system permease protein
VSVLLGSATLWQRELVRFFRQRSRVAGALNTPLVFWLLLGSGVGRSFSLPDVPGTAPNTMGYMEYFFPGTVVMILLFTSIFATISIIEDRKEGFLQGVLVAPTPRVTIVLGKVAGSTSLALIQGAIFMALAPFVVGTPPGAIPLALGVLALVAFGLTGLGYLIAWSMESTQGFHAIMNLFLIPMWLLSGAVFPATGAPGWLQWVIRVNPLTYGVAAVRWSMYGTADYGAMGGPDPVVALVVVSLFAAATFLAALAVTNRR